MLNGFRVVALALLISSPAVSQTKVLVCGEGWRPRFDKNLFSQDNELYAAKRGIDLMQPDQLDLTRITPPPELRAHPVRDARQINVPLLEWNHVNCQVADREPNGALQFH